MDCFLTKKSPSMCASFKINILNNKSIFGINVIFCSLNLKVQTCFLKLAQALLSANYQAMKILIEWLGERDFFRFFVIGRFSPKCIKSSLIQYIFGIKSNRLVVTTSQRIMKKVPLAVGWPFSKSTMGRRKQLVTLEKFPMTIHNV